MWQPCVRLACVDSEPVQEDDPAVRSIATALAACLTLFGARVDAQAKTPLEALRFEVRTFTAKNGALPHDAVTAVSLAADGAVWFGTREGVSRLSLGQVTPALSGSGPGASLPDRSVRSIWVAKDDAAIWVGTGGGLAQIVQGKVANVVTRAEGLPDAAVTALAPAEDGAVWAGTEHGLARVAQARVAQLLTDAQGLPGRSIRALAVADDGLWVATDRGLARVSHGQVTLVLTEAQGLPGDAVHALAAVEEGGLWAACARGLVRIANGRVVQQLTAAEGLPASPASALASGPHGVLWVVTATGLVRVVDGRVAQVLTTQQGLPSEAGVAISVEPDGTVWLGSQAGLSRVAQAQVLAVFTQQHGLPANTIDALGVTHDGSVWVGTPAGLAAVTRGRVARVLTTRHGLPSDAVRALAADDAGLLWVATQGGLAAVAEGRVAQVLTAANGLPGTVIRALIEGDDGVLWVGAEGGLARVVGGQVTQVLTTRHGLPGGVVQSLLEGDDGVLWVSTNAGVARVVRGHVTQVLDKEYGVALSAWSMLLGDDGDLFMGTPYGLARLSRGEVASALTQGRWLLGAVGALLAAEPDGLWAGTLFGGLARVAEGQVGEVVTTRHGLPSNFVRALAAGGDGVFWAGTDAGLVRLRTRSKPPRVLQLAGEAGPQQNSARRRFTVRAFDPEYQTQAAEWRYVWQLTRPNGESRRIEDRSGSFDASLGQDGPYVLSVRAIAGSGAQSEPYVYRFEVRLPAPVVRQLGFGRVGAALFGICSLYVSLLIVLLAVSPQAGWARRALRSWVFAKLPLLSAVVVHSRWARRLTLQQLARSLQGLTLPEHYIPRTAVLEADAGVRPFVLDGSRPAFDAWFRASRFTLLLGRSGAGKTVLLRHLARATARSFLHGDPAPIPILLDLRTHATPAHDIAVLVIDAIKRAGVELPDRVLARLLDRGGFLVLIDALDDLEDARAGAALHAYLSRNSRNLVLIASRRDLVRRNDLTCYRIADVPAARAQRYLQASLGEDLFEQLPTETRALTGLPQDLALLAPFIAGNDGLLPTRRAELYAELLRQDAALGPWAEQNDVEIQAVYTLALRMLQERKVLPNHVLRQLLREVLQSHAAQLASAPRQAIDDMIQAITQSRLFREESHRDASGTRQPALWFEHELFGRFLASRHIWGVLSGHDTYQRVAMLELAGHEAWSEVFYFVIDAIGSERELHPLLQALLEGGGDCRLRIVAYALAVHETMISEPLRQQYFFARLRSDLQQTPVHPT